MRIQLMEAEVEFWNERYEIIGAEQITRLH